MVLLRNHPLVPDGYKTPPFPHPYWPAHNVGGEHYLYYKYDIWRFTLNWTLIIFGVFHLAASAYAVLMHLVARRSWTFGSNTSAKHKRVAGSWLVWLVPLVYVTVAALEAFIAGSVVGLMLGAVYNAGYLRVSTWLPFVWSLVSVLVLIISSYSMQGGL